MKKTAKGRIALANALQRWAKKNNACQSGKDAAHGKTLQEAWGDIGYSWRWWVAGRLLPDIHVLRNNHTPVLRNHNTPGDYEECQICVSIRKWSTIKPWAIKAGLANPPVARVTKPTKKPPATKRKAK